MRDIMKGLIFTAKSNYARFRRPYTTTSALSYTLIHPIAVKGLIGSMLGIDYDNLYNYTNDLKIGIQVLNELHKDTQSFNLIANANNNKNKNFQSSIEFLRDVNYRIFVSGDDNKVEALYKVIISKRFTFTPYLGNSENIASINLEGIYDVRNTSNDICHTVIPINKVNYNDSSDLHIYIDRIPINNNDSREYISYEKVIFTINNNKLKLSDNYNVYSVGDYNVYFF